MRCLECQRLVDHDASSCPYCGSNILTLASSNSYREFSEHARTIWDETDPANNILRLPTSSRQPFVQDLVISAILQASIWFAVGAVLKLETNGWFWVAGALAVLAGFTTLWLLEIPPIWRMLFDKIAKRQGSTVEAENPDNRRSAG